MQQPPDGRVVPRADIGHGQSVRGRHAQQGVIVHGELADKPVGTFLRVVHDKRDAEAKTADNLLVGCLLDVLQHDGDKALVGAAQHNQAHAQPGCLAGYGVVGEEHAFEAVKVRRVG